MRKVWGNNGGWGQRDFLMYNYRPFLLASSIKSAPAASGEDENRGGVHSKIE
jgi:hypothetical protein